MVRIKHRYLVLNILFPESSTTPTSNAYTLQTHNPIPASFKAFDLLNLIRTSVAELFGDYGVGSIASGLKITYLSPATGTAIVRCPRSGFRMVWAGLTFVKVLRTKERGRGRNAGGEIACVVRVVRVSGTIRKAEEEVVRRARRDIVRMKEIEGNGGVQIEKLLGSGTQGLDENEDEGGIEDCSSEDDDMDDDSD